MIMFFSVQFVLKWEVAWRWGLKNMHLMTYWPTEEVHDEFEEFDGDDEEFDGDDEVVRRDRNAIDRGEGEKGDRSAGLHMST